jgi:integrase
MSTTTRTNSRGHSGHTTKGNTKDVKVARIGKVTIYKRGLSFRLYFRENLQTQRQKVVGNLAVARATAAKVSAALDEERPSPLGFNHTSPSQCVQGYLEYAEYVLGLAWRTIDRHRAALDRCKDFCQQTEIARIDAIDEVTVEDFVRWLRGQTRARNGMAVGKRNPYQVGGIKFILSTCRTAYNWASRRRMMPPYSENPFGEFSIDRLKDRNGNDEGQRVFTAEQEKAFLDACSDWQRSIFEPLIIYGMRVGELTHLLIENVDFKSDTIEICSKPEIFWRVKTSRRRKLPMTASIRALFKGLIDARKAGFVLLNESFQNGQKKPAAHFVNDRELRKHVEQLHTDLASKNPPISNRAKRQGVISFCRTMGQLPHLGRGPKTHTRDRLSAVHPCPRPTAPVHHSGPGTGRQLARRPADRRPRHAEHDQALHPLGNGRDATSGRPF